MTNRKYDENVWEDDGLPGLDPDQIERMVYMVNVRYNQRKYNPTEKDKYDGSKGVGLERYVREAVDKVKANPKLIKDAKTREAFINQDSKKSASWLCTTISRYLHLMVSGVDVIPFADYLIEVVNKGYVEQDKGAGTTFCWVVDGWRMISDYVGNRKISWGHIKRSGRNDRWIMSVFNKKNAKSALFRKGTKQGGTHTYLVALCDDGTYKMFDTYHEHYTGRPVHERHPHSPDYLWSIIWYLG